MKKQINRILKGLIICLFVPCIGFAENRFDYYTDLKTFADRVVSPEELEAHRITDVRSELKEAGVEVDKIFFLDSTGFFTGTPDTV